MGAGNVVASFQTFFPANGAWRWRGLSLEIIISRKHFECKEISSAVFLSSARRKMSRKRGSASVTGLTHENEMFPKIKEGRSRRGRERNMLNRPEYKETAGLGALSLSPLPCFQKPLDGFIPKHAELEATIRLCKHPWTLSENPTVWKQKHDKNGGIKMDQRNLLNYSVNLSPCACCRTRLLWPSRLSYRNRVEWKYVSPTFLAGDDNTPKALL